MEKILLLVVLLKTIINVNVLASNVTFTWINKADLKENKTAKLSLRYGLQQTQQCPDFQKAYLCIKYCLEFGFHIAKSDRECKCKCYKRKDHESFFGTEKTTRIFYVPTTKKPAWAGGLQNMKLSAVEKNHANFEDNNDTNDESHSKEYAHSSHESNNATEHDDDSNKVPLDRNIQESNQTSPSKDESQNDIVAEGITLDNGNISRGLTNSPGNIDGITDGGTTPASNSPTGAGDTTGGDNAPTGGGNTPTGGDSVPTNGDNAAAGSDNTPAGGDTAPAGNDNVPAGGDDAPAGSDNAPASGDDATAGGDNAAASGDNAPAGGDDTPAGGDNATAGGDNAPAGGDNATAGGDNAPAGGDNAPVGGDAATNDAKPAEAK